MLTNVSAFWQSGTLDKKECWINEGQMGSTVPPNNYTKYTFTFDYTINTYTNINLCCPHLLYNDSTQKSKTDIKILIMIRDNWP